MCDLLREASKARKLTSERVNELFEYSPDSGDLRNRRLKRTAGWINNRGYRVVEVDGSQYVAHRIIWLMQNGEFPSGVIDHIDGNSANNAWANLRECTQQQNSCNQKAARDGLKGAYEDKSGKWSSSIFANGKKTYLGTFGTEQEAHEAYILASTRLHGEFGRST